MGFFDISIYGVPVAISGMIYMIIFAPILLPGGSVEEPSSGKHSFKIKVIQANLSPSSRMIEILITEHHFLKAQKGCHNL